MGILEGYQWWIEEYIVNHDNNPSAGGHDELKRFDTPTFVFWDRK